MLWARCDLSLDDPGEVWALLAGYGSAVLIDLGLCQSLRQMSQHCTPVLGSSVGLRTINERINHREPLLQQARSEPITDVPAVVQPDGMRAARADPDEHHQAGQTPSANAKSARGKRSWCWSR